MVFGLISARDEIPMLERREPNIVKYLDLATGALLEVLELW